MHICDNEEKLVFFSSTAKGVIKLQNTQTGKGIRAKLEVGLCEHDNLIF